MKVLVIGSGGREHAISWKLSLDPRVSQVFVAPGNVGMARENKVITTGIGAGEFEKIAEFVKARGVDFVVVGPDQALADGAVDFLEAKGIPAFGPTKEASRIEWSKAYSKDLMREAGIPTAKYEIFTDLAAARQFLEKVEWGTGWVVKADGLALGKGVVVCESREEALSTVNDFLVGGAMGSAGSRIVLEERLLGREASAFFLCDGKVGVSLGMACDYKRIGDGDIGPNTGGMGAFSPADWVEKDFSARVHAEVVVPLLRTMSARGTPFKGILFVGLMATAQGPKVIEFNARFGDPETQVLLPLLDEELLPWFERSRNGELGYAPALRMKGLHGVHVVMAAAGYPGAGGQVVRKGDEIKIDPALASDSFAKVFFAGVSEKEGKLLTNGGRVLGVTAWGETRAQARERAYAGVEKIKFDGMQRRRDVGA